MYRPLNFAFILPRRIRLRERFKNSAAARSIRIEIIYRYDMIRYITFQFDIGIPTLDVAKFYLTWGIIVFVFREVYCG